ncbi:MAG: thioredoxin family protein [Sterolibacteriaceae bacterium]|nr:thioredoxin family protein [Candidatus Methylophosphatis haderslevensis]
MSERDSKLPVESPSASQCWLVACLCADWCDTCRAFRASFDALSGRHADVRFRWIDIEDESDLLDGIDVENFPTILIQRGRDVLFLGTTVPNAGIIERQLAALRGDAAAVPIGGTPDVLARLGG